MTPPRTGSAAVRQAPAVRPQPVMLSFLGMHVLGRDIAVYSGSVIDVLSRVGVSEEAVRSTLARMVKRGLLVRYRCGRRMYFGLTARSATVLEDGHHRVWRDGAVNREWDGSWTIVGFSLPESWRSSRHDLRSRLIWAGFGPLQNGMWVAPGEVDAPAVLDELDLGEHLNVFTARTAKPTADEHLVRNAFDIPEIARGYREFLQRWDCEQPLLHAPDDLARQLLLHTEWLQLVRSDPRLPAQHLPPDWPAVRAERMFRYFAQTYDRPAAAVAAEVLDTVDGAAPR